MRSPLIGVTNLPIGWPSFETAISKKSRRLSVQPWADQEWRRASLGLGPNSSSSRRKLCSRGGASFSPCRLMLPQRRLLPSGDQPTPQTSLPAPCSLWTTLPSATDQRNVSLSLPPAVAASWPSGETRPFITVFVCSRNSSRRL